MDRSILVNLPVADLGAARRFYTGLGFPVNEMYSDDDAVAVVVSDTIIILLLTRERFAEFVTTPVADPRESAQVIGSLTAATREEVDDLVARALASGGAEYRAAFDEGSMYGRTVNDPDGHVWEFIHMDGEPAGSQAG